MGDIEGACQIFDAGAGALIKGISGTVMALGIPTKRIPRQLWRTSLVGMAASVFSGDSDFAYLVKKLKSLGKGITVVSSRKTIAWELKLEKAEIIFLEDIEYKIKKT